ncbi:MAG: DNA helicase PcrA [Cyanobacteria bacterium J06641_5]
MTIDALNSAQRQAAEHFCGPLLVVAGAGSGKTRALTFRIARLLLQHRVDPENILAVTFTNKAAREMRDRLERLLAAAIAEQPLAELPEDEQVRLRSQAYRQYLKPLWIGTFHSLFGRVLRFDIDKYRDDRGRQWTRNFTIYDDSDSQSLVKTIVTKQLNLDDKKFNPRTLRYAVSNAKNQGKSPEEVAREQANYRGRVLSEVYEAYQAQLAANNALDFDDLIAVPGRLFAQNETILGYWHRQFRHILVDEYQDTNRIQYDLIRLLATNGEGDRRNWSWENRSIFAVGDADQSIYSFRMADFRILMDFQQDFGDGLPDDDTRTMVKLEENYRSRANILEAANALIANNTERIDKVLRATRGDGPEIVCFTADDELTEARFVRDSIQGIAQRSPERKSDWGKFAILYRTNAQSRAIEDALLRDRIPYNVVGGLRFYDRKEIKDALAYLRAIDNPADAVSLLRIINTPRRGIGQKTVDNLVAAAREREVSLWELLAEAEAVKAVGGRSAKAVGRFVEAIASWQQKAPTTAAVEILNGILRDSGYIQDLQAQGTDEADNRLENLKELTNAVLQYAEENEDTSLGGFLASAALASDLDGMGEGQAAVSLMTLHSAKGLEFPFVFLVGLEQGLFPHSRALDDPAALEEERRLCYVGITRAQEQLFMSHARERFMWGSREPSLPSQFLEELPEELIKSAKTAIWVKKSAAPSGQTKERRQSLAAKEAARNASGASHQPLQSTGWSVGDSVKHKQWGIGFVSQVFGSDRKQTLAVKFPGKGTKVIDPTLAPMQRLE